MTPLWLLRGPHAAPGWSKLEQDAHSGAAEVVHFDRDRWALVRSVDPPSGYEGLMAVEPQDGNYLDQQGRPFYLVDRQEAPGPRAVIKGLGEEAEKLLGQLGDPDLVLERLGRIY